MSRQTIAQFTTVVFCLTAIIAAFCFYFLVIGKIFSACQGISIAQLIRLFS